MQSLQEQDPDRIADYRLIGRLGEGGMGVVYLARSPRGRMVAVKIIRAELAAALDFRRRFAEEIAVARRVGGKWTAAVLAADPDAALPWVATAYVAGPTLHQVVAEQGGPLPENSVRGLASGLCQALGDIHDAGLIHRDLKPSNVMVTINGPKVIDFGIVRALDASTTGGLTATGAVIGSPGFMSPEQIRGEKLTGASDIFSLGTVLAFAATGRLPFDAQDSQLHALMYRVVHEPPDLTGVPEPLLGLIKDCLAKDPAGRPTLNELRAREETQYRSLEPWLPSEVLARLGQEAVQLLDQEDPRTRMIIAAGAAPGADPAAEAMTVTPAVSPQPLTAKLTMTLADSKAPVAGDQPHQQAAVAVRSEAPQLRLVDERRRARGLTLPADGYRAAVYWLLALFALVSVLTVVQQLGVAVGGVHQDGLFALWESRSAIEDISYVLLGAQVLFGVGLVVGWLIWFVRVRAVAERLAPGQLRYRESMAAVGWFIPVGNLFLPKQIANDVWHASSPPGRGGGMGPAGLLHAWWFVWLATFLTWPLYWTPWMETGKMRYPDGDQPSWYDFQLLTWFSMAVHVLVVPAVVVAALYVHRLTVMQAAKLDERPLTGASAV
ncbi:protein kinase domain-containing protein [Nonomuraea sp. CA-143628]|uniref:protein kinase domain-containing protein n=1 Tax=Nonomuraea sp. CA-143628 TaxID=3239997 RepID=UPI003D8D8FE0